ncbi:MAG: 16S rRNA (guanine(527)-N(7))-methyltransferase RsmG [Bacteroidia bacterium]
MELITKYFPELSQQQIEHFSALKEIYEDWNAKINVISRKNMDQFYCNHVLHSLAIAKLYSLDDGEQVLDIGTGGGFPGIPLAIFYPNTEFTLVDSIRKKTKVVEGVKEYLNLKNVTVINDRFENISDKYDTIVSRAVAPASKLVGFTKNALKPKGNHIFLKGGDLALEKAEVLATYRSTRWYEHDIKDIFEEEFFETKKVIALKSTI